MGDQWFAGTIVQLHPTCLVQMDGVTDDQLIVLDLFDEVRKLDEQPLVNIFFQTSIYMRPNIKYGRKKTFFPTPIYFHKEAFLDNSNSTEIFL